MTDNNSTLDIVEKHIIDMCDETTTIDTILQAIIRRTIKSCNADTFKGETRIALYSTIVLLLKREEDDALDARLHIQDFITEEYTLTQSLCKAIEVSYNDRYHLSEESRLIIEEAYDTVQNNQKWQEMKACQKSPES